MSEKCCCLDMSGNAEQELNIQIKPAVVPAIMIEGSQAYSLRPLQETKRRSELIQLCYASLR